MGRLCIGGCHIHRVSMLCVLLTSLTLLHLELVAASGVNAGFAVLSAKFSLNLASVLFWHLTPGFGRIIIIAYACVVFVQLESVLHNTNSNTTICN